MRDPQAPRKPLTAYFLFAKDTRPQIVHDNPTARVTEVSQRIATAWAQSVDEVHAEYQAAAEADRQRYHAEMAAYHAEMAANHAAQHS
ncbi:MAG: hypothetical protein WC700_04155 [Gemmatimonadaceae bacterium]